jgi:uncharacterized membrane protein
VIILNAIGAAAYAASSTPADLPPDLLSANTQTWVSSGMIATIIILLLLIPLVDKIKSIVGGVTSPSVKNAVDTHNDSDKSHSDIRTAIALLNKAVIDLQKQIDLGETARRDSIQSVQHQLQTAIELLQE